MNICLIRPRYSTFEGSIYPPLGLITMAPYFGKNHTIRLNRVEDRKVPINDGKIEFEDVQVITAYSEQLWFIESGLALIHKVEKPRYKVVVGGPGVTSNPEYAKRMVPHADLLIAGDGEYFAENIEDLLNSGVKFVDYREHPYPLENKKLPSWGLIDYEFYKKTVGLGVETSRGCPFNCVMCTAHLIHGKQWVGRNPKDVANEIETLRNKYGCRKFYFADDNATANPSRWYQLMWEISNKNLGVSLSVPEGIQAHNLDQPTLWRMQLAGLNSFTIGAESGSQRVLDKVINKGGLTVEKIEDVIRLAVNLKMKPSCFFVIGFPGETLKEAEQTVEFAQKLRRLGAVNCTVRNAIPMPGTKMFEIAKQEGYLTVPEDKLFDSTFVHKANHLLKTSEWNPEDIDKLVAKAQEQEFRHIVKSNIFRHPRATAKLLISKFKYNHLPISKC